jgi:hypothetical protein
LTTGTLCARARRSTTARYSGSVPHRAPAQCGWRLNSGTWTLRTVQTGPSRFLCVARALRTPGRVPERPPTDREQWSLRGPCAPLTQPVTDGPGHTFPEKSLNSVRAWFFVRRRASLLAASLARPLPESGRLRTPNRGSNSHSDESPHSHTSLAHSLGAFVDSDPETATARRSALGPPAPRLENSPLHGQGFADAAEPAAPAYTEMNSAEATPDTLETSSEEQGGCPRDDSRQHTPLCPSRASAPPARGF